MFSFVRVLPFELALKFVGGKDFTWNFTEETGVDLPVNTDELTIFVRTHTSPQQEGIVEMNTSSAHNTEKST